MGFREELETILSAAPAERRTLLFSATIPHAIESLARSYQRDPVRLSELNTSINDLYAKIMGDETMIEYNEAKEDINDVIKYINAIVTAAVDGEDPLKVEPPAPEGCGPDGCDGCAGCG